MTQPTGAPIASYFADLTDPRSPRRRQHRLLDILTIAICASICGADNWVDVALFGRAKEAWFKSFLALPSGIPSHDTFGRVFARLDPEEFQRSFASWVQAIADVTKGQVIAFDGKTARRSHNRGAGKNPIHMVNVWASENGLALGQAKVDDKSNEITAIPDLLRMLDVSGCIVTIDAMGCQKDIAKQIVAGGADYVLAVKANQGRLHEEIEDLFSGAEAFTFDGVSHEDWQATTKGHGRLETRQCWVMSDAAALDYLEDRQAWPRLAAVVKIKAVRRVGGDVSTENRYFITSLAGDAKRIAEAVRSHWAVENSLHWVLDIAFREDESRVRKDHGPHNLAILRQLTLNLLKRNTEKASIKSKRLLAGWREDFLLQVLFG